MPLPTIHDRLAEQTALAATYAKDGAFRTAAARLRATADELEQHADWCDGDPTIRVPCVTCGR